MNLRRNDCVSACSFVRDESISESLSKYLTGNNMTGGNHHELACRVRFSFHISRLIRECSISGQVNILRI